MNITKKISLQNIKKNWKASLLTIISISLSVAMTTMVVASLFGVYKTYEEDKLYKSSKWNVMVQISDDLDEVLDILGDTVDSYAVVKHDKYVDFSLESEYRRMTVNTIDFDANFTMFSNKDREDKHSFNDLIIEGRLPQNNEELVITERSISEFNLNLGDTVTINQSSGNYEDPLTDVVFSEATIVGIISGTSNGINYSSALMRNIDLDTASNSDIVRQELYIKFKPSTNNIDKLMKPIGKEFDPEQPDKKIERQINFNGTYNTIIGMQFKLDYTKIILGITSTVFIVLLSLATFSLITNAFYNNIQTQVHDYGLLRSIGATKKQLKSMIRFEGYILLTIGLALGIGIGFGISQLLLTYINGISIYSNQTFGTEMSWFFSPVLPWEGILIIAVFSFVLVSFPLNHSIKKLFKMTSIDAIREDHRYSKHKLKINSKNISKSLAFQYNISDKSKFRGIRISLTITIAIFITTMSFIKIGFGSMGEFNTSKYNVQIQPHYYYSLSNDAINEKRESFKHILQNDFNTKKYLIYSEYSINIRDENMDFLKLHNEFPNDQYRNDHINILLLDSLSFKNIYDTMEIKENDIDSILINLGISNLSSQFNSTQKVEKAYFDIDSLNSIYMGESVYDEDKTVSNKFIPIQEVHVDYIYTKPLQDFDLRYMPYLLVNIDSPRFSSVPEVLDRNHFSHLLNFTAMIETTNSFETIKSFDSNAYYISNQDVDKAIPKLIEKTITNILISIMTFIVLVCLLNVVNISLTNLNTRKRELAALRSVGMSQKQVQKMLFYESIQLVWSPMIFGTLIGILASFSIIAIVNLFIANGQPLSFGIDLKAILISWCILLLLIVSNTIITIMKSRNHSIIDSLRNL
ncbi:MAG: FtsX-like permease family protein [Erysipelothrix sp.]